ncbi:class I SAM-dependent methyltransferase [Eubacteriales bacterium OttesenSCG-928-M02]|nr:class I SAM-dependent methyltransferase [Eubacteriales bacterium OttesenSCG-928-M02]
MERIEAICQITRPVNTLADIGCDHGQIGYRLLADGQCQRLLAVDISPPSLDKARRLFAGKNMLDRVAFSVSDGLACAQGTNAAIIAGMGGYTITHMLEKDITVAQHMDYLVLAPHNRAGFVRRRVAELGFTITEEAIAVENGRHYPILRIAPGTMPPMGLLEEEIGPINLTRHTPEVAGYLRYRKQVAEKILRNMEKGGAEHTRQYHQELLSLLEQRLGKEE